MASVRRSEGEHRRAELKRRIKECERAGNWNEALRLASELQSLDRRHEGSRMIRRSGNCATRRGVQCLGFSSAGSNGASVAIDDKYDGLQRLVQMGKEKGYVLYDEVSEVLPGDLPGGIGSRRCARGPRRRRHRNPGRAEGFREEARRSRRTDRSGTSRRVSARRSTTRCACICARWARCPLLTREGEVEIARRIERGQNTVLKSLSRAPLVIQEIVAMGEEMTRRPALRARHHPDRRSDSHRRDHGRKAAGIRALHRGDRPAVQAHSAGAAEAAGDSAHA